ncbi:type II secretion system F family protein [Chloroflexota bacterium]
MEYKYSAQTVGGEIVDGVLEADSLERAEELLWRSNLAIVSLKKQLRFPSLAEALPSLFGVKRGDVVNFSRDLSTMLNAGLPMLRSLDIIYRQAKKPTLKSMLRTIIQDLEKGSTFSEACSKHSTVFPPLFIRLVRVGEEVGSLSAVLEQLSTHMAREEETASKVKGALAYPTFVLLLAVAAVFVMITFVMPAITGLFNEFGAELPLLARIALGLGEFASQYILFIMAGMLILIVTLGLYIRTPGGGKAKDTLVLKLPIVGEASLKNALARTARSMAMMVRSGVPLTETLSLCADTAGNAVVKDRLNQCNQAVYSGTSLSQAMSNFPIFPVLMTQMVGIGEETGKLEYNLEKLSGFYETEAERSIARLTGMLGPGMILIVGVVVGFVAVTLFSSIYSVGDLMGG